MVTFYCQEALPPIRDLDVPFFKAVKGSVMLKKTIKKGIRTDYWHYMSWQRSHFGFFPAIIAFSKLYFNGGIGEANAPLLDDSICIRPGTTDQDVFHQIFFSKEYAADLGTPDIIVDAGAHIGLSALFLPINTPVLK